jgi:hypothetical protein
VRVDESSAYHGAGARGYAASRTATVSGGCTSQIYTYNNCLCIYSLCVYMYSIYTQTIRKYICTRISKMTQMYKSSMENYSEGDAGNAGVQGIG